MIKAWNPDFIVAAGDLAYEKGSGEENVFKGDPISCYRDYIKSAADFRSVPTPSAIPTTDRTTAR